VSEVLLLHVSDTHLGASRPLSHSKTRELDFYDVFDEVVDIALREGVDAVLHCGDLFDTPEPGPRAYYHAVRSLKKLSDAGIPFLVIAGQHDQPKRAEVSPLKVLEEVGVARVLALGEPETHVIGLRTGELGVSAIPYAPPGTVQHMLKKLKKPGTKRSVLMAHLLLKELGLPMSHTSLLELGVDGFNYVALGDYHLRWSTNYAGIPIAYPGSTEALDVLESSDERYVAAVDLSGEAASVSWIKLSRFRRVLVADAVSGLADLQRVLSRYRLEELGKPPILYVRMSSRGSRVPDADRIVGLLRELVRQGRVLSYRLALPGADEEESEGGESTDQESPPPTLDYVVYEVVKDPELSELLLKIVRGSESGEESLRQVIDGVLSNERLVEKLGRVMLKR
jgi:exonuclease SbcD